MVCAVCMSPREHGSPQEHSKSPHAASSASPTRAHTTCSCLSVSISPPRSLSCVRVRAGYLSLSRAVRRAQEEEAPVSNKRKAPAGKKRGKAKALESDSDDDVLLLDLAFKGKKQKAGKVRGNRSDHDDDQDFAP